MGRIDAWTLLTSSVLTAAVFAATSMNNTAKNHILILPALIVTTPFFVFLNYNSYCIACAETWMALGGLIAFAMGCSAIMLLGGWKARGLVMAALIMFFIDLPVTPWDLYDWAAILLFAGMQSFVFCLFLREKFFTIITAFFLTAFVVSVFQLSLATDKNDSLFKHPKSAAHAPPRIIHLILDEHIGIEGIPADIEGGIETRSLLSQFFLRNGFQLFGGAFSRYLNSHISMANMVNFRAEHDPVALISGSGPYKLLRNKYFELLSEKGYHIEVLSTGWIDFCSNSTVAISRCGEISGGNLKHFAKLELPVSQKLQVLYWRYLNQSSIVAAAIHGIVLPIQSKFPALAPSISQWIWAFDPDRSSTNSLNALIELKLLWSDILSLPHGTIWLAHILLPHYPYVAYSDCSIRPTPRDSLWNSRVRFEPSENNTIASRKERYREYFEQLTCLQVRLDELFDRMRAAGIYDDSIIILHGDHGSRIVMREPTLENQQALTEQDLVDGFSTLFAMKLPGKPGRYDPSPLPLEQLLARFAYGAGLTSVDILPKKIEPYVYLKGEQEDKFIRVPYVSP